MTDLFLSVLNRSISASWLVLAVLALRLLLKRSPKWIPVLLWGIVALRLLCPVSIESALSLIPRAETVSPEIMLDWSPQIDTGVPLLNEVLNPVIAESFTPNPAASANPLQILIPVAALFWLAGMGILLLYTAASYLLLRRKVAAAVRLRYNIFQSEFVTTPFVLGILKPRIYLPYTLSKESLIHVISHEKAHIRRKDHWWKPLGLLPLTVHWFNPLMWLSYRLFSRDLELACDERVLQNMSSAQRADYAEALLSCSIKPRLVSACPIAFGEVGVKTRIRSVMNYKKPAFWILLLALIACAVVALCFLTNPKTETAPILPPAEAAEPAPTETSPTEDVVTAIAALSDLTYSLELAVPGKVFQDMDAGTQKQLQAEYGNLLDGFALMARESSDGTVSYIAGWFTGEPADNPFRGMFEYASGDIDRALITEEIQNSPEDWYVLEKSDIRYEPESGLILIQPTDCCLSLWDVFGWYLQPNGRAYIADAVSRGILLHPATESFLEVYLISEIWGEVTERIPLTEDMLRQIHSEPRQPIPEGCGFSASLYCGLTSSLYIEEEDRWFNESTGVPQTVLDLAVEKCGYRFSTPADIRSDILEARLDCPWLEEPLFVKAEDLPSLQKILTGARFGYIGGCGYDAKLTIQMADGSSLVMFKGCDGCDTIAFGSYGGYFLGDPQNVTFWQLFGLDPETKQPL